MENMLLDLQEEMEQAMNSPYLVSAESSFKFQDYLERFVIIGMQESIKFVIHSNVASTYICQLALISTSIRLSQWRITEYLLENINFTLFVPRAIEILCQQAVNTSSARTLKKLFNLLSPRIDLHLSSIASDSFYNRMFLNFDSFWERFKDLPDFSLRIDSKFKLIFYALGIRMSIS